MKLSLGDNAEAVIDRLHECGYDAYAVGGCVRDLLIGMTPSDVDITTSAKPKEIIEAFSQTEAALTIPTGIAHGTVTVIYSGQPIEVTTYRIDGEYSDSRRPDSVEFTDSLIADLSRRDFTVNAMAYSHLKGLCDPFGGRADLAEKRIRCVGAPHKRFSEDALRIMRALRFSSTLGFHVDDSTAQAAIELCPLLEKISKERISAELEKLVCGKNCERVLVEFEPVIKAVIPELGDCDYDKIVRSIKSLKGSEAHLLLAALLAECEAPSEILKGLRFDKKTCVKAELIAKHCCMRLCDKLSVKRLCRDIGVQTARDAISLGIARGELGSDLKKIVDEIIENNECVSLSMLKIDGNMLKSIGLASKNIGKALDVLLERVMSGELENEAAQLLCAAREIIERK